MVNYRGVNLFLYNEFKNLFFRRTYKISIKIYKVFFFISVGSECVITA